MKKNIFLSYISLLFLVQAIPYLCSAQISPIAPYVPSPQAWDFMAYGNVPIGYYTGRLDLQIPVYQYNDKDFNLPISIGYNSMGFNPGKPSGALGLNWFLNCGGMITRQIVGVPDDMRPTGTNDENDNLGGLIVGLNKGLNPLNEDLFSFNTGIESNVVLGKWVLDANSGQNKYYETTPDIYSFNFMGYNGKFTIGYDGNVKVWDCAGSGTIKVDISGMAEQDAGAVLPYPSQIIVTTGDGYRYTFGGDRNNLDYYYKVGMGSGVYGSYTYYIDHHNMKPIVTWHLTKAEAPNGRSISFEYMEFDEMNSQVGDIDMSYPPDDDTKNYSVVTTIYPNQTQYVYSEKLEQGHVFRKLEISQGGGESEVYVGFQMMKTAYLKSIIVEDGVAINFEYSRKERKDIDTEQDRFVAKSWQLNSIEVYNQNSFLLKKAEMFYTYQGGNIPKHFLDRVALSGEGDYKFMYNIPTNGFPSSEVRSLDYWGFWKGGYSKTATMFPQFDTDSHGNLTYITNTREPDTTYSAIALVNKVEYPTGGYTSIRYEPHSYSLLLDRRSENSFLPFLYNSNGFAGGARVKEVIDNDELGNVKKRSYEYKLPSSEISSGILMTWPRYMTYLTASNDYWDYHEHKLLRTDATGMSVYCTNNEYLGYRNVVEKFEDGGCIEYEFSSYHSNQDDIDQMTRSVTGIDDLEVQPVQFWKNIYRMPNDRSIERGKLLKRIIYNANRDTVSIDRYSYASGDKDFVTSIGNSGNIYYSKKNYAYSYLPKEHKNTLFDINNGTSISKTKAFEYNKEKLEKKITESMSNGDSIVSYKRYANDLLLPELPGSSIANRINIDETNVINAFDALAEIMPAIPVEETKYVKHTNQQVDFISASVNLYGLSTNSKPLLYKQLVFNALNLEDGYDPLTRTTLDRRLEIENIYDLYDDNHNLLQFRSRHNVPVSYVWGYNGLHPVMKIAGADFQQVKSVLNEEILSYLFFSQSFAELSPYFELSRNSLDKAHIFGYTYQPSVGLASETSADGLTVRYRYDIHGRLLKILDNNQKIVKQYQYHYKNQNDIPNIEMPDPEPYNEPIWVLTGEEMCEQNDRGTTGFVLQQYKNVNPYYSPSDEVKWEKDTLRYGVDYCPANYTWERVEHWGGEVRYKAIRSYDDGRKPTYVFQFIFYPEEGWGEPTHHKFVAPDSYSPWWENEMIIDMMLVMMPGETVLQDVNILFGEYSSSDTSPWWGKTENTRCLPLGGDPNGYVEFEEKDSNPYSDSFGETRWVEDRTNIYPEKCPAVYRWTDISTTDRLFTIKSTRSYNDGRPATYVVTISYINGTGQSKSYSHNLIFPITSESQHIFKLDYRGYAYASILNVDIVHEELPPLPDDPSAHWVSTGSSQCAQNERGNSGYLEYLSIDQNPQSITYNQEQWIVDDQIVKKDICPADYEYNLVSNANSKMVLNAHRSYYDNRQATLVIEVSYTSVGGTSRSDTRTYNFPFTNSGTDFTFELDYSVRANATLLNASFVYERLEATDPSVMPGWEGTGVVDCEKDSQGRNTGYTRRQEVDTNPHSPEYGQEKWSTDTTPQPSTCPADYWSEYISDVNNVFVIRAYRSYNDNRSATYRITVRYSTSSGGAERTTSDYSFGSGGTSQDFVLDYSAFAIAEVENIEIIYGPHVPDTSPWWTRTGTSQCNKAGGMNSGYVEYYEVDLNPNSPTHNRGEWRIDTSTRDVSNCPANYYLEVVQLDGLDGIIELKRSYNDGASANYRFDVRVYEEDSQGNIIGEHLVPNFQFNNVFQGSGDLSKSEIFMLIGVRGSARIENLSITINR